MLVVYKYTELLLSSRLALFEVAVVTALFAPVRSNNLKLLNPRGSCEVYILYEAIIVEDMVCILCQRLFWRS